MAHGIHGEEKLRLPARTIRLSPLSLCGFWDGAWKEVEEARAVGQQGPEIGLKGVKRRGITGHERRREERTE